MEKRVCLYYFLKFTFYPLDTERSLCKGLILMKGSISIGSKDSFNDFLEIFFEEMYLSQ